MKIYKYPLNLATEGKCILKLPSDAKILSAGVQDYNIVVWAICDQFAKFDPLVDETKIVEVAVVPTGVELNDVGYEFIQTVFIDWMVLHLFVRDAI